MLAFYFYTGAGEGRLTLKLTTLRKQLKWIQRLTMKDWTSINMIGVHGVKKTLGTSHKIIAPVRRA